MLPPHFLEAFPSTCCDPNAMHMLLVAPRSANCWDGPVSRIPIYQRILQSNVRARLSLSLRAPDLQTGSGKTFSMDGSRDYPGIIPRSIDQIFTTIQQINATNPEQMFLVRISYLEASAGASWSLRAPPPRPPPLWPLAVPATATAACLTHAHAMSRLFFVSGAYLPLFDGVRFTTRPCTTCWGRTARHCRSRRTLPTRCSS